MHIRSAICRLIHEEGDWRWPSDGGHVPGRLQGWLTRPGWSAMLSVPLPGDDLVEAALDRNEGGLVLFDGGEELLDVWMDDAGKVLSIRVTDDAEELISIVPGPWEMEFGLPDRLGLRESLAAWRSI